ncbi:TraR/DksA family transcriptional regulator [Pelagibacterium lentulum]|uniref:Molecular chaperone DnaK n=1 Tax=Pelagibacterium lentulum TaxID=2029865 RepID=A0A916RER6_9HYPH|nr:TraR/DksA C4-type zinc finger protein [Pelagibacterium lentulum]GGA54987.1 molecular chaperone DnaK [Pelagibacterium lentulum]
MAQNEHDMEALRPEFISRIKAELEELAEQSSGTEADRAPVALDQQSVGRLSRMDAMAAQEIAQASERRRAARKVALQAALGRFEEDEYGYCVDCGEPIALGRLKADPAVTLCIQCAQMGER